MSEDDKLNIFKAQTENVQYLEKVWKHLNRAINHAYLKNNDTLVSINTKLLIQVYCAYAESIFSKTIHTPYGLSINEIEQVKNIANKKGIINGWKKCFELSIAKVSANGNNYKPNTLKKINLLIDLYLFEPHLLRNKIAHGQWKKALNSNNTNVNNELTEKIGQINIIDLYRYKEAFHSLYKILEDMVESPNKAHLRDYWDHIVEFEKSQQKMSKWTIENKINQLKEKYSKRNK